MVMYSRMIMHGPDLRCSYICSTKELLFASDYLDTHTQLETKAWKHAASLHGWHLIQGMFMNDEFERAKEVYLEAIGVSADCLEAIYNLGLVNMHIGNLFAKKTISVFYGHWDTKNGYKRAGGWAMPLWQASIRRPCWPLTSCILSPMWIATWRFSLRFFHWCTAALNMLFVHVYIIHVFLICIYISYIVYECKPKEEQVLWQGVGSIFVCWRFHFNIIYVHSNRIRCHAARRSHVATGWYSWEARQSWQGWVRWFRESAAVAGRKSWTDRYMSPKCWSIWSMQWIFLLYTCWCLANSKKCIYRCNNVCIYIYRSIHAKSSPRTSFAMLVAKGMRNIWHGPCVEREKRRENEPYSWHDFLGFFVFAFFWCCLGSIATLLSCFFCKYSLRMFTYGIFFQFSISLVSSTLSNELFFFRSLHSQSRWSFRLGGAWMVFTFGDFTKRSANRPRQGRWVRVSSNTLRNKENCLKIWGTIARLHHK